MGKGLHKVFKAVVNDILQALLILSKSGSKVSYFIPETRKFAEVTRFPDETRKPWLKETLKEINNLINNQTFIDQYTEKGEPVTP